jgi:hypothetical protein
VHVVGHHLDLDDLGANLSATSPMIPFIRWSTPSTSTRRRHFEHQIRWYFAEYAVLLVEW